LIFAHWTLTRATVAREEINEPFIVVRGGVFHRGTLCARSMSGKSAVPWLEVRIVLHEIRRTPLYLKAPPGRKLIAPIKVEETACMLRLLL
jgi:hypothetical protein